MDSSAKGNAYTVGDADTRPWGSWRVIDAGETFAVKRISVDPGQRLSLQLHHGRDEHWTVVAGRALVQLDDEQVELGANQSVHIPVGVKHRVENPGPDPLVLIEVQVGEHLDENDIVRFDDNYGRA